MFKFSYEFQGLTINFAIKSRLTFIEKLNELQILVFQGRINNVKFY